MACIFNTVLLDLSAALTDSFEGRGPIRGGGLIGAFTVHLYYYGIRVYVLLRLGPHAATGLYKFFRFRGHRDDESETDH